MCRTVEKVLCVAFEACESATQCFEAELCSVNTFPSVVWCLRDVLIAQLQQLDEPEATFAAELSSGETDSRSVVI